VFGKEMEMIFFDIFAFKEEVKMEIMPSFNIRVLKGNEDGVFV
jgi:hypothetical protein